MRAGEHQGEPLVGNLGGVRDGVQREQLQIGRSALVCLPPPREVDHLPPRHGQQPTLRIDRTPLRGPVRESGCKRFRQCILRRSDIARAGRKKGDELAVTAARNSVRRQPCLLATLHREAPRRTAHIVQTGRTSIVP